MNTTSILLHCCCAPCASLALEMLSPTHDITMLFYNPNIRPKEEFDKRSLQLHKLLYSVQYPNKVKAQIYEYDSEAFSKAAEQFSGEPEGGMRCRECFRIRLEKTASLAKSQQYDYFATALTVSPHKNAVLINEIGNEISRQIGVEYFASDFKKQNGYNRSVELSKLYGLYRQNYCGCGLPCSQKGVID